ncbi:MAG: hypothetical protein QXZ09_08445, partial [Candidatus Methanomethylicaceae archaeon]
PFGENAHLVWTKTNGQSAAVGLIRQGNKTLNISVTGEERVVRFLPQGKVEKLVRKLREKSKFQEFEGKLAQKGKRVGKIRALFDETNKIAILGIAAEGDDEKIAHQVRIKVKAGKDDEPEDDAEPQIQATACGQATGEAVPMGIRLHAQMYDAGEGGDVSPSGSYNEGYNYEGPEICVSQWGYSYICNRFTPLLQVGDTGPLLLATFIGGQARASFTIWNAGGRTLTGTATVTGPFTILSGGSFSLAPGQPQKIVVGFTPSQAGRFLGEVRFTNSAIKVYLEGKAYTFEEYLQLLVEFYNQLANLSRNPLLPRRPAPPILYVPAAKSLAFGFDRLSTDIVEQMVEIADQLQGQPPSPQTTSSSSDSTASEIELALQELSLYLNDPNFPQHLERIKSQYPAFAVFLESLAVWLGQDQVSLARNLANDLQQQSPLRQRLDTIEAALEGLGVIRSPLPGENLTCGISGQTYPCSEATRYLALEGFYRVMIDHPLRLGFSSAYVALTILDNFLSAMEYILFSGRGVASGANLKTLMEQLLNTIPYMYVSLVPPGGSAPSVEAIRDFVSLAQLLGNMVVYGRVDGQPAQWQFYAFGLDVGGGKKIEIIATIQLRAFRDSDNPNGTVTIFANTFDFYGQEAQDRQNIINTVVAELSAAINYIKNHGYSDHDNIAVGFVRSQIDDSTAQSIMNQLNASAPGAPVLLVYCVANCDSANPVYHFRYRGMTEQQAKALACALGFSDFCARSYEVVESGPPWDSKEEELCPMAMVGSDCSEPPPSDPPPMP